MFGISGKGRALASYLGGTKNAHQRVTVRTARATCSLIHRDKSGKRKVKSVFKGALNGPLSAP
jgi:hypothetical protein